MTWTRAALKPNLRSSFKGSGLGRVPSTSAARRPIHKLPIRAHASGFRDGNYHDLGLPELLPWAQELAATRGVLPEPSVAAFDLVRDGGDGETAEEEFAAAEQGLGPFKTVLGAFMYDKGYRQMFRLLGFPGVDAEHAIAAALLADAGVGPEATVLDVSCGPGMFSELLLRDSPFSKVIASDFSPTMVAEAAARVARFGARAAAVRADVSALPFADASLAAAHSAAGMHCWPDPAAGLSEVRRVLRPGAPFIASTVTLPDKAREKMLAKGLSPEAYARGARQQNMPFWEKDVVAAMFRDAGFENVEVAVHSKVSWAGTTLFHFTSFFRGGAEQGTHRAVNLHRFRSLLRLQ